MNIQNIAVFIDFENFYHEEAFDITALINSLKERGRLIVRKAYADWGTFARYKKEMLENSVELIELPSHTLRGKNSSDIKLVVDALEFAITKEHIDTIVVVSGDSDYTPLIAKLREYNKYVIVIGHQEKTSSLLKGYCDELIYYTDLIQQKSNNKTDIPFVHAFQQKQSSNALLNKDVDDVKPAYKLLTRAIHELEQQKLEPISTRIKIHMKKLHPEFDEAKYGFSKFTAFLKGAEKVGIVSLTESKGNSGNYVVRLLKLSQISAQSHENVLSQPQEKEKKNGLKTKDEEKYQKIHAILHKGGMIFLGVQLQEIVLKTMYAVLSTLPSPFYLSEIILVFVGKLQQYINNGELTQTDIGKIRQILYRGHCFTKRQDSDNLPTTYTLDEEIKTYEIFRSRHDISIMLNGITHGVDFTAEEWAIFLYNQKQKAGKIQVLLAEATKLSKK